MTRSGINPSGFARRSGRLPAASPKRKKALSARKQMLKEFYSNVCAGAAKVPHVRCSGALDPHEPLTRARGGSITDPENLTWICRGHHDWVHANPKHAHAVGLLKHSWEKPCTCTVGEGSMRTGGECPRAEECFDNFRANQALLGEMGK